MNLSFALFLATVASLGSLISAQDIPATAIAAGTFETLVAALTAADLVGALSDPNGPFTVFAPSDDAFAGVPPGLISCLLVPDNKALLSSILSYHVVPGATVLSTDLMDGQVVGTLLEGASLTVDLSDGVKINTATVVTPDVTASNGVIHVIDSVLVPPGTDVAAFLATCPMDPVDIPTTAIAAGTFETLVAALTAADLVGALSDPNGPFTVFAPTDDAFAALPEGLVGCLLNDVPTLSTILLYHVANGSAMSTDLMDGMTIASLEGTDLTVDLSDGVKVDAATVIAADIMASNGVIHVVDSVLTPGAIDVAAYLETCTAGEEEDAAASLATMGIIAASLVGALAI